VGVGEPRRWRKRRGPAADLAALVACRPARSWVRLRPAGPWWPAPLAAHPGPVGLRSPPDPLSNLCSIRCFGGDLARLGVGPTARGSARAVRAAARRRPRYPPRFGRRGRALPPRRRDQDLEPDAVGAPAPPRGVRPAPRWLPRPSTNAAVMLTGLTRLTGI
jgi:hypothetical protein